MEKTEIQSQGIVQISEQDMGMFSADFNDLKEKDNIADSKFKKPKVQTSSEVVADSGAMPVNMRDDSSESSINSVKNKGENDKIDSARQNQFKMKWERV